MSVIQHPNVKQPTLPGPASLGRKERRKKEKRRPAKESKVVMIKNEKNWGGDGNAINVYFSSTK